ncbi:MAG: radical SAM protein [Candidatus Omnitrophota bacterium]
MKMGLITSFDPWRAKLCSCPAKYSLSAYSGCGHGCLYCYASSYIPDFSKPRKKKDFIKRLSKELIKLSPGAIITIANSSDPYQPIEKNSGLTRKIIHSLVNTDKLVILVTKSSLIVRDLALIKDLSKAIVTFSITTLDNKLSKKLEPQACLPKKRLNAVESLSKYIPVAVRLDPLIYPVNTTELKKTIKAIAASGAKQLITSTYKAKPDNFKRMALAFKEYAKLWNKLYNEQGQYIQGSRYLPLKLRQQLIETVREASLSEGLLFSSCREGFTNLNTASCDGSSLF